MSRVWSVLKWPLILAGVFVAYAIYDGMEEVKQGYVVLYCLGFAGFWFVLKEIREVEQRLSKRLDYMHKRLNQLEGRPVEYED